ncbi:MAG TPA: PAS domain S-box protein, partial [Thermoplasmata archaeon]|nr:PAS domain S-box protein [Thermoplasmata archaeon]
MEKDTGEKEREVDYFRAFVESLDDWVWEMDVNGIHTYSNRAVEKILGYKVEEVVGFPTTKLWRESEKTKEKLDLLRKSLKAGKGWKNFRCKFKHKNGSTVFTESTAIPIFDSENKLVGYRGVDRNITKRVEMEKTLQRKEAILKAVSFASAQLLKTDDWEKTAEETLVKLGKAAQVDGVCVFKNYVNEEGELLTRQIYGWIAPEFEAKTKDSKIVDFPWVKSGFKRWIEILSKGKIVQGQIRDFPETERKTLTTLNIKSLLVVPIIVEKEWWGFISFSQFGFERVWSEGEIDALKIAAEIIASAVLRKRMVESLIKIEEECKRVNENIRDVIYSVNEKGEITFLAGSLEGLEHISPEIFIGENILNVAAFFGIPEEKIEKIEKTYMDCLRKK